MDSGWRLVAVERALQGAAYMQQLLAGVSLPAAFGSQGGGILDRLRQMGVDVVGLSAYGDDPFSPEEELAPGGPDTFTIDGPDGPVSGETVEIYDPATGDLLGTLTTGADGTITFDPSWPMDVDVQFDIPSGEEVDDGTGTHTGTYRKSVRRLTNPSVLFLRQLHYVGQFTGYSGGVPTAIVGLSVAVTSRDGMTVYGTVSTDSTGSIYARVGDITLLQIQFDVPAGWKLAKPFPLTGYYMPGDHVTQDVTGSTSVGFDPV